MGTMINNINLITNIHEFVFLDDSAWGIEE